jgi:hypothetical protein
MATDVLTLMDGAVALRRMDMTLEMMETMKMVTWQSFTLVESPTLKRESSKKENSCFMSTVFTKANKNFGINTMEEDNAITLI